MLCKKQLRVSTYQPLDDHERITASQENLTAKKNQIPALQTLYEKNPPSADRYPSKIPVKRKAFPCRGVMMV